MRTDIHEEENHTVVRVWDSYAGQPKYTYISIHRNALNIVTAKKYAESLCKHIQFVREAGEMIGVDPGHLAVHDDSKWSHEEFLFYALNFHGDKSPVDSVAVKDNFVRAWLHHIHHNPHHWQHWIFPDGYAPSGSDVEPGGLVQMPNIYAKEMIADWMGASMAYTGSFDMADWLQRNMPRIKVHSKTAVYLREQLDMLGYADVVYMQRFGSEAS